MEQTAKFKANLGRVRLGIFRNKNISRNGNPSILE